MVDYCGTNCQSAFGLCGSAGGDPNQPTQPVEGRCGPDFGGVACTNNECCSQAGYCGTTIDFCADPGSCEPGFGRCDSDTTPAGPSTANAPRPKKGPVTYSEDIYDCVQNNVVALTYDDGPAQYTGQLLDLLKKYGFTATFFVTGNNNGKGAIDTTDPYPGLIRRMVAEGHQVASHTWSHYSLSASTSEVRKTQMVKNEMALVNIIGKWPTYMRPPYSQCSVESGCTADMEALGYHRVYFDLDTQDYLNPDPSQIQKSKDIVLAKLADASVTDYLSIQHDIVGQSVTNLSSTYFDAIAKRGWKGVTAAECLGDTDKENWYRSLGATLPSSTTAISSSTTARPTTTTTRAVVTTTTTSRAVPTTTSSVRPSTTTTTTARPTPTPPTPPPAPACIVQNGKWCGQLDSFSNKDSCSQAAKDCRSGTTQCLLNGIAGFGKCMQWSLICSKLSVYCLQCRYLGCSNAGFRY